MADAAPAGTDEEATAAASAAPNPGDAAAAAATTAAAASSATAGAAPDADADSPWTDPAKAEREIKRLRKEAGDQRINAKKTASDEARAETLRAIQAVLDPEAAKKGGEPLTVDQLTDRLQHRRPKDSASSWLRRSIGLDPVAISLMRESSAGAMPRDAAVTAGLVKAVPVVVTATMPIERAISTAGGIAWSEVDEALMLRRLPGTFVAGEMLDWEAPTGGYLLQASFSTGVVAAKGARAWLQRDGAH